MEITDLTIQSIVSDPPGIVEWSDSEVFVEPPSQITLVAWNATECPGNENLIIDLSRLNPVLHEGEDLNTEDIQVFRKSDMVSVPFTVQGIETIDGDPNWRQEGYNSIVIKIIASDLSDGQLMVTSIIPDIPGIINLGDTEVFNTPESGPTITDITFE